MNKTLFLAVLLGLILANVSCKDSTGQAYDVQEDIHYNLKCMDDDGRQFYLMDDMLKIVEGDGKQYWLTEFAYFEYVEESESEYILVRPTWHASSNIFKYQEALSNHQGNIYCEKDIVTEDDMKMPEDSLFISHEDFVGDIQPILP